VSRPQAAAQTDTWQAVSLLRRTHCSCRAVIRDRGGFYVTPICAGCAADLDAISASVGVQGELWVEEVKAST